ncbi:MAG: hypothetical protein KKG59_05675 [Nanoarchaeota archaeon]|nr:hypothetical protein [Nanoarchaeota archaeon]
MTDVRISYETLFDILRREKNREELQELPTTFFQDVLAYLTEKQSILEKAAASSDSIFASKEKDSVRIQLENVRKILRELFERRENKLIRSAQDKARTGLEVNSSCILPEEKEFFESFVVLLRESRNSTVESVLSLKKAGIPVKKEEKTVPVTKEETAQGSEEGYAFASEVKEEIKAELKTVRFLNPLPRFMGTNLEVFGPFDEDEVANLPTMIADLLVKKGRAEEISQG